MELAAGVNILWSSNSAAGGIGIGMFPTSSAKVLGQEPQKFPPIQRGGGPQASPSASRALHAFLTTPLVPAPVPRQSQACQRDAWWYRRTAARPAQPRWTRCRWQPLALAVCALLCWHALPVLSERHFVAPLVHCHVGIRHLASATTSNPSMRERAALLSKDAPQRFRCVAFR